MRGRFQRYRFCVYALCGGVLTIAVMVLPETLHAGDGHGSDGSGRAAPLVEIAPLSPAWYIEITRLLLHAGSARDSYQMVQLAAERHLRSVDVSLAAAYAAAASGRCVLAKRHLAQITGDMTTLWQSRWRDSLLAS